MKENEFSTKRRIIALIIEGIVFTILIPVFLVFASSFLDGWFYLPRFYFDYINIITGVFVVIIGFLLAIWSIKVQFVISKGTPAPIMPTKKLVIQKPYSYYRNPMALGTFILYLGVCILLGSISAVGLVLVWFVILLIYIKLIEEKELEFRFGMEYLEYKRQTPFLIPNIFHSKSI